MEEPNKFGWAMNSSDQIQTPFANNGIFKDSLSRDCCTNFPNIIPLRNVSISRDQFSFLQGTVEQQGNNSWNCHNNSKPIDLDFGGSADLNLMCYDPKERYQEFGTKRQQGLKIVNKGLVPLHPAQDHIIAERTRREKLNQRFIELSSVIPSLKKVLLYFHYILNS